MSPPDDRPPNLGARRIECDVDGIIAEGSVAWAPHNSKGSKQNGAVTKRSTGRLSGVFVTEGRLEERVHTHTERGGTQWERGAACV